MSARGRGSNVGASRLAPEVQRLAAARLWAANRFPYLASALFASPITFVDDLGTIAADRSWRLYADPEIVQAWSVEQVGSMLVHHVGHLLRDHATRANEAGVSAEESETWLHAADAEINDDLAGVVSLPDDKMTPEDLGLQPGRLAEEYFVATREGGRARPEEGSEPGDAGGDAAEGSSEEGTTDGHGHDCGSCAHGHDRPWEQDSSEGGETLSNAAADLLRRQVAGEILAHAKEAGHLPLGLKRWAEAVLQPKVDWRKALAAELRRGVSETRGRVDYSYRRPSRRAGSSPDVVLPALRRPVPEVAVVCDTSGSMTETMLTRVLAEVEGLLRSVGVGTLRVLSVDTEVHTSRRISTVGQLELAGGGGTDMGAGIEAALALRPRPGVVVVLTDGETPWPSAPPKGTRVVVGLLGERAPAAPAWARSVRIDDVA